MPNCPECKKEITSLLEVGTYKGEYNQIVELGTPVEYWSDTENKKVTQKTLNIDYGTIQEENNGNEPQQWECPECNTIIATTSEEAIASLEKPSAVQTTLIPEDDPKSPLTILTKGADNPTS